MTIKRCLCREKIRPGMLVCRHFCGGTIIGEVKRVNYRSVRIRLLNDARTALSDEHVTLKFLPSSNGDRHDAPNPAGGSPLSCWCVTGIHELTPEVAKEKYFRDMLLGCNPYIAKKIGWTERMSAETRSNVMTPRKIDELIAASPSFVPKDVPEDNAPRPAWADEHGVPPASGSVTEMISAGKYNLGIGRFKRATVQCDLEREYIGDRDRMWYAAYRPQLNNLFEVAWKHGDPKRHGLNEVVYWYNELLPLVIP